MSRLPKYIESLRALAREPEGIRLIVAEQQINDFVRTQSADAQSSLERLRDAITGEVGRRPNESSFWIATQGYVDLCLSKYSEDD